MDADAVALLRLITFVYNPLLSHDRGCLSLPRELPNLDKRCGIQEPIVVSNHRQK